MYRIGRIIINEQEVVKVVNDKASKSVTVSFKNGSKAVFKKHAEALWQALKLFCVKNIGPSAAAPRRY